MNIDVANINRVIERVKAEPKAFKMADWVFYNPDEIYSSQTALEKMAAGNTCGTAACLGGWMNILALQDKAAGDPRYEGIDEIHTSALVQKFLGTSETYGLFNMGSTSDYLSMSRFDQLSPEERARAGTRALEIFRDTGSSDWTRALKETGLYDQVAIL